MLFFLFKALIISRAVVNLIFLGKDLFYCMRAQHVLSYHLILVPKSYIQVVGGGILTYANILLGKVKIDYVII